MFILLTVIMLIAKHIHAELLTHAPAYIDCVVVLQVMSACCLFLAGKVEETPKKCKDIIRTVQLLLSPEGFQAFGDDPRVCPGHRPAGV